MPDSRAQEHERWVDALIAALAGGQHGVVARFQLLARGLTPREIEYRLERGRLHGIHRGVYAVGHRALSVRGMRMAAVLAGGEDAVLSHRSAAALHGIRQWTMPLDDVTVPRALRKRPRLQWHRAKLPPDEVTIKYGIPVTTVPRTIFDLAADQTRREVERAIHEAEVRRLHDALSLHDLVARYPNRQGIGTIKAILADLDAAIPYTRNGFEELFHDFIHRFRLPAPRFNEWLQVKGLWIQPDAAWPAQRVIGELDGRAVHGTRRNLERDPARDRMLVVAGWRVVRITWHQLNHTAHEIAADLRTLLGPAECAAR
jgi:very-short-patch-repair endonuclease/predicted transcriptional regulator of viral defense system